MADAMLAIHIIRGEGLPQAVQRAQFGFQTLQFSNALTDFIRLLRQQIQQYPAGRFPSVAQRQNLLNVIYTRGGHFLTASPLVK